MATDDPHSIKVAEGGTKAADPMASSDPVVDEKTRIFKRAINDHEQAYSVAKRIIQDNKERNARNGVISDRLNDVQPWEQSKMEASGQGWRHNRSTGFLSSIQKRVMIPYIQAVDQARVLTHSALQEWADKQSQEKSESFQLETTRLIRSWSGWNTFKHLLVLENTFYGHCAVGWTDESDWRPQVWRSDEAQFPNNNPQSADDTEVFVVVQEFWLHELAAKLENPETSKQAGWDIDNVLESLNAATESGSTGVTSEEDMRKYSDAFRNTNIAMTFQSNVKSVPCYHVFAKEHSGMVSHFIVRKSDGKELFRRFDRFDSMADVLQLFTVEVGNGKLHGSRGTGRLLYNTAIAAEQSRNLIADQLYLSGLIILKTTTKSASRAPLTVMHPVAILDEGWEIQENKITANIDSFFALDRHLTTTAEMQVSALMPTQLFDSPQLEKPTASEVNYVASIEQQIRNGTLMRFLDQFYSLVNRMQRKIYSEENIAEAQMIYTSGTYRIWRISQRIAKVLRRLGIAAKILPNATTNVIPEAIKTYGDRPAIEAIIRLLQKNLTVEEILLLSEAPSQPVTDYLYADRSRRIDIAVARYAGNPSVNQQRLMEMDLSDKLGTDDARKLIIPQEDQTVQAEAARLQLIELQNLMVGDPIPVSPRDADAVHMGVIMAKADEAIKGLAMAMRAGIRPKPEILAAFANTLQHFDAHLAAARAKGASKESLAQFEEFSRSIGQTIANIAGMAPEGPEPSPVEGAVQSQAGEAAKQEVVAGTRQAAQTKTDAAREAFKILPNAAVAARTKPLSEGPINLSPSV